MTFGRSARRMVPHLCRVLRACSFLAVERLVNAAPSLRTVTGGIARSYSILVTKASGGP